MNKHPSFIHQVKGFIREHSLICAHDRILVAFSGGPDSTALTEALLTLKPEIDFQMALFHLNHGLRGEESVRDELFCQSWAQWQGIDLFIEHCDVCRYHQDHHALSLEEAAREVRYQMLQRVAERWKATKIALGHQADDQTETVLMNIIRGCGIDGLRGMAPEKEMYIRPLLTCRREDIMDFLRQRGIPFVDDSTNQDTRFLRNRIRHRLLPLLRDEYNPGIDDSLIRLAFNIQETLVLGHSLPVKQLGEFFSLPLASLAGLSIGEKDRLIRDYVQTVKGDLRHISREHIRSILYLAGKGKGETILPGELKIWIHDQSLYARIGDILFATVPQWSYPLQFPGRNDIPEIGLCIEFQEDSDQPKDSKGWHCILDQEKCEPPFFLRNFSDGDRIVSSGKERKLKELFLEKGIPSEWRRCLPLVCDRKKILWIPGILLDERARVQDNSKSIHFISARKC